MMLKEAIYLLVKNLARLPLNYVIKESRVICKRRIWGGQWLIWGTKIFRQAPFIVLPEREWLAWEPQMYRHFYSLEVRQFGRMLVLPTLPGIVLADYWRAEPDPQAQLQAFAAAVLALYQLHQHMIRLPGGSTNTLYSHADATCHNVLYDVATDQAIWFDFETVHPAHLATTMRHAHDVQVLADSAAALLPITLFPQLAHTLFTHYPNPQVQQIVLERAARPRFTLLALAQTRLTPKRQAIWYETLRQVHGRMG